MNTFDLAIHAEDVFDLAAKLAAIADNINTHGGNAIPEPGEEKTVLVDGEIVGAISSPGVKTDADRANLSSAERTGTLCVLRDAAYAISALNTVLEDGRGLNSYTRGGLHRAMELASDSLAERAEFLSEQQKELGFTHDHNREIEE